MNDWCVAFDKRSVVAVSSTEPFAPFRILSYHSVFRRVYNQIARYRLIAL